MTQMTIGFDAPHNGTPTSRAAAQSIRNVRSGMLSRILAMLAVHTEGLSCDDLESLMSLSHQTASARLNDLLKAGKVYHYGTRETRSGRRARIYFKATGA